MNLTAIMDDNAGRKSTCGREMENNEFSWSGLMFEVKILWISGSILCLVMSNRQQRLLLNPGTA